MTQARHGALEQSLHCDGSGPLNPSVVPVRKGGGKRTPGLLEQRRWARERRRHLGEGDARLRVAAIPERGSRQAWTWCFPKHLVFSIAATFSPYD